MVEHEDITDDELDRVAQRIRSIRRRELRAKVVGVGLALFLGLGLYAASYLVLSDTPSYDENVTYAEARQTYRRGRGQAALRLGFAAIGLAIGVGAYIKLAPREDPADVG